MQCTNPLNIEMGKRVPCGRCIACRINKGQEWSLRLLHELSSWDKALFVTLTYDDEHVPVGMSLVKGDLQRFFKRMRKEISFKYYACGEYGGKFGRPHYHGIIFGLGREDFHFVESNWNYGYVSCGSVTEMSINYVTKYVNKKLYGPKAKEEYNGRLAPFNLMSKGLGLKWFEENQDHILQNLGLRKEGRIVPAPRYYMKKLLEREVLPIEVLNNRVIVLSQEKDRKLRCRGKSVIEGTEMERLSRRQKEYDLEWRSENVRKSDENF